MLTVAHRCFGLTLLAASLLLVGPQTHAAPSVQAPAAKRFVIARVSQSPGKHLNQLAPMADYLGEVLADFGYSGGGVVLAESTEELLELVLSGRVDWVTETPYTASLLIEQGGMTVRALKLKNGVAAYRSLIFARRDAHIHSLQQLRDHRIAFEEPDSFSGYFMPSLLLQDAGLTLQELPSPSVQPTPGQLGFVFARSELNVAQWVHKGLAQAGALNNLDWDNPKRMPPAMRQDLVIIAESQPFPRALELAAPGLPGPVAERVTEALLALDVEQHAELLRAYEKASGFQPVDQHVLMALEYLRTRLAEAR